MRKNFYKFVQIKKTAFTLAEVLITLGIIGVVAAITIPTLIANTNSAKFRSQLKKTISTLNQAARMSDAQYGFDFAGTSVYCGITTQNLSSAEDGAKQNPEETMSFCALLNGTLTGMTFHGYVQYIPVKEFNNGTYTEQTYVIKGNTYGVYPGYRTNHLAYSLSDGSIVAFDHEAKGCTLPLGEILTQKWINSHAGCRGFIDVNGTTLPNKEVSCSNGVATSTDINDSCVVKNDAQHMTDIYPVVFHDANVEPATNAAKYVFMTAK